MDDSEFNTLYRRYGAIVQRRAARILGDEQAGKDALQEVFMRVLRARDQFRGTASMTTWIYRITTNYCLNVLRDRRRREELLLSHARAANDAPPARTTDDRIALVRVLGEVPEELREIAIYFFVDQMNRDEIAALMGISRRTVGNRLEEFRTLAQRLTSDEPAGVAQ